MTRPARYTENYGFPAPNQMDHRSLASLRTNSLCTVNSRVAKSAEFRRSLCESVWMGCSAAAYLLSDVKLVQFQKSACPPWAIDLCWNVAPGWDIQAVAWLDRDRNIAVPNELVGTIHAAAAFLRHVQLKVKWSRALALRCLASLPSRERDGRSSGIRDQLCLTGYFVCIG